MTWPSIRLPKLVLRVCTIAVAAALIVSLTVIAQPTQRADAAAPALDYEVFTGSVDDFYVVPSPLPAGAPGQLIRVQAVGSSASSVTMRMMYHSVDGAGRDRAVTGMITYPTAAPPPGGWPVVSIANGTVGMASQCALSRHGYPVSTIGLQGVGVASDYIGEGPVGELMAYLSRKSEGHSVIDAVRAARNLSAANAGKNWVSLGGSQGGHGALATNELAAGYAPELHLLGTVALAPAAMFENSYGPIDELVTRVVGAMGLLGISTEDPSIKLSDYVGPAGLTAMDSMRTGCMDQIIPAVLGVPFDSFYIHDPMTTEPAASVFAANDVGNVKAPSPVLLVQGTADVTVFPARTQDLFARMCGVGQVTDYQIVQGADHTTVGSMDNANIESWLADRVAGLPAPNSCAEPPDTSSTTTTSTSVSATSTSTVPVSSTTISGTSAPTTSTAIALAGDTTSLPTPPSTPTPPSSTALPVTGTSTTSGLLVGLGLLVAGALVVAGARRRRQPA